MKIYYMLYAFAFFLGAFTWLDMLGFNEFKDDTLRYHIYEMTFIFCMWARLESFISKQE